MLVYVVQIPMAGSAEGFPVCECLELDAALAVVAALLRARVRAPDKVVIDVREEVRGVPPF